MPDALLSPAAWPAAGGAVELIETHISWVFLVGDFAYKVKKPVRLDFLDFSTAALRRHFCREELRLNKRFAPQLYLGLSRIVRTPEGLAVDRPGRLVEVAVRMRRFDRRQELDALVEKNAVSGDEMAAFGSRLAQQQQASPVAGASQPWAVPARTLQACRENFAELSRLDDEVIRQRVARLSSWTEQRFRALESRFSTRQAAGRFRECHGDLHCSNLVRYRDELVAFDALEFDPGLHWIDVANDLAFLYMDLRARGHDELGALLLDGWIAGSGDFDSLAVLRFYEVYRAGVRAKVAAIRLGQHTGGQSRNSDDLERYLLAAERAAGRHDPCLIVMAGPSGAGKSWLAARLLPDFEAVRLRSDVERKRLCGLAAQASSGGSIYSPDVTRRTYQRLAELARDALRDDFNIIVDAANLRTWERDAFRLVAREAGVPFELLWMSANPEVLRRRIAGRAADGNDPSEADAAVMEMQLERAELPAARERADTLVIDTEHAVDVAAVKHRLTAALARQRSGMPERPRPDCSATTAAGRPADSRAGAAPVT